MSTTLDRELPGLGRLEAFSDGVLAIVITLLVLEIKVPHLASHANGPPQPWPPAQRADTTERRARRFTGAWRLHDKRSR